MTRDCDTKLGGGGADTSLCHRREGRLAQVMIVPQKGETDPVCQH